MEKEKLSEEDKEWLKKGKEDLEDLKSLAKKKDKRKK